MSHTVSAALVIALFFSLFYVDRTTYENIITRGSYDNNSLALPPVSSNWVATDGEGRSLPTQRETGPYRPNKYVGIFYFLLHGAYNDKVVYDISALTKANPVHPKLGPETTWHWWGEPEVGYFKADDPWVIRRNLQLLTLAGVDILFLDVTNADLYLKTVSKLCEISSSMRKQGIPTPYICFVTYTRSGQSVSALYNQYYAQNQYPELWFRWQGKPLILGKVEEVTDATVRDFFTWRFSWAWTNAKNDPHNWQWIDRTPQNYGWDTNPAIPEEIPVAVASHPFDNNTGKSFQKGLGGQLNRLGITSQTGQGIYFDEQWKRALQVDPAVVFVTGWNEWIAQHFVYRPDSTERKHPASFMGKSMKPEQSFFIDLYNQEYNRDIDPMKGGYSDNYYYQLVANIRRFKGMPAPEPASSARSVRIDGKFNEWASIRPHYMDPPGDVAHRNWPRADNKINYVNTTGRNDITDCKVAHDAQNVFFYVKTNHKLTPATDPNWMLLYIDTDQSAKTGWTGYDILLNKSIKNNKTTIYRWSGKGWTPTTATGLIRYTGNELELSLPLQALGKNSKQIRIDFHWADNIKSLNNLTEFFINGDSAPDRRFKYRYNAN